MKFTAKQSDLSANLALVSRAVPSRPSHPILANVLVEAKDDRLTLTAFDLSLGIRASFDAAIEFEGKLTMPAKLLTDIVSRLPDGVIQIEATFEDDAWKVAIVSDSGTYNIRGMSADEFPELPEVENGKAVTLPAAALIEGLRSTLFAASSDETKGVLCGIRITQIGDSIEQASSDGHRLSVFTSPLDDAPTSKEGLEATVPAKALQELIKMLERSPGSVDVSYDSSQIVFTMGDFTLSSRLLEGQYPNYRQLIPHDFTRQITVDRRQLLSALERIAVLADQKNNICKVSLNGAEGAIALSVDAQDVGSGKETIPAQITGDDLDVAFNVKYLMDFLKVITTAEVLIQLNTATSPAILTPLGGSKMTGLIMPVQIRSDK